MQQFDWFQISILVAQCVLISVILLSLFRLRKIMGIGLLFTALGVFQFMQVFLASTVYMEVYPGFIISPGSILYCGTLFAVLLIYIREDALQARKVIYALVAANLVVSIFQLIYGYNLDSPAVINSYSLPSNLFYVNAWLLFVGTALFYLEAILAIIIYEYCSRLISFLFLRILFTMCVVLVLDSLLFNTLGFIGTGQIGGILFSGIISKMVASVIYSILFTIYLLYFEKSQGGNENFSFNDIFYLLTYRQKFEQLKTESQQLKWASEKALWESEKRYSSIFNLSPVCLWEIDLDEINVYIRDLKAMGVDNLEEYIENNPDELSRFIAKIRILNVNMATLALFKAGSQEHLAKNIYKIFAKETYTTFKEELVALSEGRHYFEAESEMKTLEGDKFYVHISLSVIAGKGTPKSVGLVAMTDISDRRRSENALRRSEASLKKSQQVGKLGNWELDFSKGKLSWSEEVYRIFNLEVNEYEPTNESFLSLIHPEDREKVKLAFNESLANTAPYQITYRLLMKDQSIKYISERCEREYDENGDPIRSMGTVSDVTEIVKAEEKQKELARRNKLILDTTLDGFLLINTMGDILEVNDSYSRMIGYSKLELLKMNLGALESRLSDREIVEKILEIQETTGVHFETAHRTKNGHILEFDISASMMRFRNKNLVAVFCRDITRQKIAENELRESKEFLQNALDSVHDGISLLNIEGSLVYVNPSLCKMTGFTREELLGTKPPCLYWPEEHYATISAALNQIVSGSDESHELIFKTKVGRRFPVIVSPAAIRNDNGDVINFIATIKDISERNLRERALAESENRFRTIFEQAAVGVALSDTKTGKYLRINQKYCDIVGFTFEEMMKLDFQTITHPEDLEVDMERMNRLIEGSIESYTIEKRFISKSRKSVWVKLTVSPMWIPGEEPSQHIAVIEDVSHVKQLNDWKNLNASILEKTTRGISLETVLSDINEGIDSLIPGAISSTLLLNGDHKLIPVGLSKLPKPWTDMVQTMELSAEIGSCGKAMAIRKRVICADINTDPLWKDCKDMATTNGLQSCWSEPIISSDLNSALGTFSVYFSVPRQPTTEEIRLIDSVSHILSIIVEKSRVEDEIINYKYHLENLVDRRTMELEKINQELESFSYSVSHDLRAPLTRIDGFSKALQDSYSDMFDEKGRHYLERIRASSHHMANIIDDILSLSRVTLSDLTTSKVDLSQLSQQVFNQLRKSESNGNFDIEITPGLKVNMDAGLARLLMENLISNAIKFSKKSVKSNIVIGSCDGKEGNWIYVRDNGIGFDMKYYDQLFLPFKRLHPSEKVEGSGIGLATVRRIIEKHGGQIKAKGKVGKGATFYFKV